MDKATVAMKIIESEECLFDYPLYNRYRKYSIRLQKEQVCEICAKNVGDKTDMGPVFAYRKEPLPEMKAVFVARMAGVG